MNGIASAIKDFFDPNDSYMVDLPFLGTSYSWTVVLSSLVLAICVALVVIGGIQRIAHVSQVVVPAMAVLYVLVCVVLLVCNIQRIPAAFVHPLFRFQRLPRTSRCRRAPPSPAVRYCL